jgi:hypothetical protein
MVGNMSYGTNTTAHNAFDIEFGAVPEVMETAP